MEPVYVIDVEGPPPVGKKCPVHPQPCGSPCSRRKPNPGEEMDLSAV